MSIRRSPGIIFTVIALGVVLAISAASQEPDAWRVPDAAKQITNPVPKSDAALAAGKSIFAANCASCHGDTGKGDGPDAMMYTPEPADLSDPLLMNEMSDGAIFYRISEGRKPMPAFKEKLSEEQRWQVVHFVRTLAPKAPSRPVKKAPGKKTPPK